MSEPVVLLVVDAACLPDDLVKIQDWVTTSEEFASWWNHLPKVFMLETQLSVEAITKKLDTLVPGTRFLVTEIDPDRADGRLPEMSWKWIENRSFSPTEDQSARF